MPSSLLGSTEPDVSMLHLSGDVDGGVEPAATTEGLWPKLATS